MNPRVSVIIPAYNASETIREAIKSIQDQTFSDFEILVVDDASTDETAKIIEDIRSTDERVVLISNKYEKGIVGALNSGIESARGEFLARMDHDDLALPQRFEKQVQYLTVNKNVGVVGSWVELFGKYNGVVWKFPDDSDILKITLLFYGALTHPSVMIRKQVLIDHNIKYDFAYQWTEDFDFFNNLAKVTDFGVVPEILLRYRTHEKNVSTIYQNVQPVIAKQIRTRELKNLGIDLTEEDSNIHERISKWDFEDSQKFLEQSLAWFSKIIAANTKSKSFNQEKLIYFLNNKLLDIYKNIKTKSTKQVFKLFYLKLAQGMSLSHKIRIILLWKLALYKKLLKI